MAATACSLPSGTALCVCETSPRSFLPLPHLCRPPTTQTFNPFGQNTRTFRYWEEAELVDLATSVGLGDYQRVRSRMYIMFVVTKPGGSGSTGGSGGAQW
jgi:hypothetical protein